MSTDRESEQVKVADTPDPPWDGAWDPQGAYVGTLFQRHPGPQQAATGISIMSLFWTGELLYHLASEEDVNMPACGKEGGGSVGAECQDVLSWTW